MAAFCKFAGKWECAESALGQLSLQDAVSSRVRNTMSRIKKQLHTLEEDIYSHNVREKMLQLLRVLETGGGKDEHTGDGDARIEKMFANGGQNGALTGRPAMDRLVRVARGEDVLPLDKGKARGRKRKVPRWDDVEVLQEAVALASVMSGMVSLDIDSVVKLKEQLDEIRSLAAGVEALIDQLVRDLEADMITWAEAGDKLGRVLVDIEERLAGLLGQEVKC